MSVSLSFRCPKDEPSKIFNFDLRPLDEVFRTVFNYNYPAKCRSDKKYEPKGQPEKPHPWILLVCRLHRNKLGILCDARAIVNKVEP
jgi:hypothetical protein